MSRELETYQRIEQSISKKFRKTLWRPFVNAVKQYELIQAGDRIAVCISGGKDSFLDAKLLQMLQRHSDVPFELVFLVMDPGYNEFNRQKVEDNAKLLNIPIQIFDTDIFDVTASVGGSPCYLCARMRRGYLYSKAKELGCNKIALGHHLNDVLETVLMSMFYGSQLQGMAPKLHSTNFAGMTLIRPLYCVREEDILAWKRYNGLDFIQCACRFTENCSLPDDDSGGSKRKEMKILIRNLKKTNPDIETSMFNALHAVHIDTFPGYKSGGERHSFLERFQEEVKMSDSGGRTSNTNEGEQTMNFYVEQAVLDAGVKILFAAVYGIDNHGEDPEWAAYREKRLEELYSEYETLEVHDDPILEGFNILHDRTGVKRRKNIPASENLIKLLKKNHGMFYINQAVDIYNLISLESKLALGAHNIDRAEGNVTLRFTDGSERFVPIGQSEPLPVAAHEYSYCDDANEVLCRLEIRQVEKTKVDEDAQNIFYIVQGNDATPDELLRETAERIIDLTTRYCGGRGEVIVPTVV